MPIADELRKLDELRQSGALTDEEYAKAKARVLHDGPHLDSPYSAGQPPNAGYVPMPLDPVEIERQTRQWAMLLHISLLLPVGGLLVPILIWQLKKADLPGLDAHGKIAVNWIISLIIYGIASFLLMFVLIGIPMLFALAAMHVIFPIIGAVKANEGELWKYPLSIQFIP